MRGQGYPGGSPSEQVVGGFLECAKHRSFCQSLSFGDHVTRLLWGRTPSCLLHAAKRRRWPTEPRIVGPFDCLLDLSLGRGVVDRTEFLGDLRKLHRLVATRPRLGLLPTVALPRLAIDLGDTVFDDTGTQQLDLLGRGFLGFRLHTTQASTS